MPSVSLRINYLTLGASLFILVHPYSFPSLHSISFSFTQRNIKSSASCFFILFVCVPQSLVSVPIVCVSLSFILTFNPLWSLLFRFLRLLFIADEFGRSVVVDDDITCVVPSSYVARPNRIKIFYSIIISLALFTRYLCALTLVTMASRTPLFFLRSSRCSCNCCKDGTLLGCPTSTIYNLIYLRWQQCKYLWERAPCYF